MRAFSYRTLIRLSSILILLLAFAFETQAQDRTASVELNNKSAIVSIFPDQFAAETFDKINAAIVREPGMKWRDATEAQVTLRSDGSKSAVALGYGHHEIRFIEKKLGGILTEVHLGAAVYVPYPSLPGAEELAKKFAPISVFHREEEVYPVELKDIFNNDNFAGQTLNVVADKRDNFLTNEIEVSLDNMDEFLVNNIGSFNRLNPTFHEQTCHAAFDTTICKSPHPFRTVKGDRGKATVYWHLSREPDRDYLTYYYFYAFDYKNGSVTNPPPAAHALDRESFTIEFDTSSGSHKPISITFGAHLESQRMLFSGYEEPEAYENTQSDWTGGRLKVAWENAVTVGNHPVVYMAEGSHGIFPAQGWYRVTQVVFEDTFKINVRRFVYVNEQAGSRTDSVVVLPGTSALALKELPIREKSVLNFSGDFVKFLNKEAKFPPFVGRLPSAQWVSDAEQFASSCPQGGTCVDLLQYTSKPFGISDWRAIHVSIDNKTNNSLSEENKVELRARNSRDRFDTLESKPIGSDGYVEFFTKSESDYFGLYIDDKYCGEFTSTMAGFENNVDYLQSYSAVCTVLPEEVVEPEPEPMPEPEPEPEPKPMPVDDAPNDNDIVGNLAVALNVPNDDTDDNGDVRNSVRWYFENPSEKLYLQECSTRKAVSEEREDGDPSAWLSVILRLGRSGVDLQAPIMVSMKSCVGITTRTYSGMTLREATTEAHCGTDIASGENLNNAFADDFDFDGLCTNLPNNETPVDLSPPVTEPIEQPEAETNTEFVLNVPEQSSENNSGLRNSIAWYQANPDEKLYTIECATRPANGFVVGNGSSAIVNPGIIVETFTDIVIGEGVLGWNAVSNILEKNGVALFQPIQKSISACQLLYANLGLSSSYEEAVAMTLRIRAGDFADGQ